MLSDVICFFQAADSPLVLSVPMTWVKEGGMVRLDKKYLQANYKGVSSDDIIYTIAASDGQPKYGTNAHSLVMQMKDIRFKAGSLRLQRSGRKPGELY